MDDSGSVNKTPLAFPVSRVRKIMKADFDVGLCQNDAVLAMAAAAEVFIDNFISTCSRPSDAERRKTITYRDVAQTVVEDVCLHFLLELIPRTTTIMDAMKAHSLAEKSVGDSDGVKDDEASGAGLARSLCAVLEEVDDVMDVELREGDDDALETTATLARFGETV